MQAPQMNGLLAELQADPALRAALGALRGNLEAAIRLAEEKGYRLTRQEAEAVVESMDELSDDDLEQAAGGAWNDPPPPEEPG
jgi:predicted ribosomally synthesized peptide with nif11-like leader